MDTVQKIMSVATDMFRQYGFKTITMDDIARRAGISKKTLYQHFATKSDVVTASMNWFQKIVCDRCDEIEADSDNAVEAMVRTMGMIEEMFRKINPLSMLELQRFFPDAYTEFRTKHVARDIQSVADNIMRGTEEGYYREALNADILARYRIESCMIMLQPNLLASTHNPQAVNQEISENFLYGLMTAKGERLYQKYKDKYLKRVPTIL